MNVIQNLFPNVSIIGTFSRIHMFEGRKSFPVGIHSCACALKKESQQEDVNFLVLVTAFQR